MNKNTALLKTTLLLTSMMTMMAGAVVAPSLPQIKSIFIDVDNIDLLSRLVITLPAIFIAVFSPIFGIMADKLGRKKLLLFSLLLYAIGGTSGYFLDNIYYILIGRAVLGIAVGGVMTIVTTLIGDYFTGDERNSFAGLQGAFVGVGGIVFISVAGIFADIHWQMPFLIYLFALPVIILGTLYLYEPDIISNQKEHLAETPTYDVKRAAIIYVLSFLGIIFFYMVPVQIPFLIGHLENSTSTDIGLAISLSTFSMALTAMSYKKIKRVLSFRQLFQLSMVFMSIGYVMIALSETYFGILSGLFVSGLGTGILMPTGNLWIMSIAPDQIRGTLVGRLSMAMFLGMFLSPIFLQPLINVYQVSGTFIIAAVSMVVLALILFSIKSKE